MTLHETPKQSEIILKNLKSENHLDWPITKRYPGHERYFLAFHPFLISKSGDTKVIGFNDYANWPKKQVVAENYNRLTWREFLSLSGMSGLKQIDDALAFYHCARRLTDRSEYIKLINNTENGLLGIVEPTVDRLPEIIEDQLLNFFFKNNFNELYLTDELTGERELRLTTELFNEELNQIHCIRINTIDNKLSIIEDFDCRFTYIFGDDVIIDELIHELDLEGFNCDEFTTQDWSYDKLAKSTSINWDKKKHIHSLSLITPNQL
jgi:hypothetical protein